MVDGRGESTVGVRREKKTKMERSDEKIEFLVLFSRRGWQVRRNWDRNSAPPDENSAG